MKKIISVLFAVVICLSVWLPFASAFEPVKFCEDSEIGFRGFLRNDLGMFTQSLPYADNGNQFAGARTTFRGFTDLKLGEQFSARLVTNFAWEPWYPTEHGADSSRVHYNSPGDHSEKVHHYGKEYSEYNNLTDVIREAYIQYKPNNIFDIKLGRQIAIWGESLTDSPLDVVQPPDLRYGFFVGNQEDARIPQWMARATYQLPALRSGLELIVSPNWVEEDYRVGRVAAKAAVAQDGTVTPGQRFAQFPEDRSAVTPWVPWFTTAEYPSNSLSGLRYGLRTSTITESMQFGLIYWHSQSYTPAARWGERLPNLMVGPPWGLPSRTFDIVFPMYDIIGLYGNKQLEKIPGVIRAEVAYSWNKPFTSLKGLRTIDFPAPGPAPWMDHYIANDSGVVRRDWLKYMVAYDLNGYIYPQWHKTAAFDVTFEHIGEWIPNAIHDQLEFSDYNTTLPEFNAAFNVRVATSWFYGKIETSVIAGYQTFGASGLVMPVLGLRPGWFDKNLTFDLKYTHIYGRSHYEGMGIMKGKDLVMFTTQYNF